jgi:cytochrome P450
MSITPPPDVVLDVDPFSDAFLLDPFRGQQMLRDAAPVVRLSKYGIWAAARYDEVFAGLMDYDTFISGAGVGITNFHREPPPRPPSIILEADPPLQTRTHKILLRALSPAALRSMREPFEREAEALVDRLLAARDIDGFDDIAQAFPLKVFPDAVGLPEHGREVLPTYGNMVFNFFGPHNERFAEAMAAAPEVSKAVMAICERAVVTPDGLAANVFASVDSGDCTYGEAAMLVRSLLSAGLDTTVQSIACALVCFARFPEQWDRVRADPSIARNAFDEAIRLEAPVQTFFRTAARTTPFGGITIGEGEKIVLFLGSANRDPRKWENADAFDVTRKTGGHVGFGVGIHRCVGEMLAKLEGEILVQALAKRVARFELLREPAPRLNNTMRGYASIPLRLHAA